MVLEQFERRPLVRRQVERRVVQRILDLLLRQNLISRQAVDGHIGRTLDRGILRHRRDKVGSARRRHISGRHSGRTVRSFRKRRNRIGLERIIGSVISPDGIIAGHRTRRRGIRPASCRHTCWLFRLSVSGSVLNGETVFIHFFECSGASVRHNDRHARSRNLSVTARPENPGQPGRRCIRIFNRQAGNLESVLIHPRNRL